MKKKFKKAVAVILTAAMAMSVGAPAFAAEEDSIVTIQEMEKIVCELSEKYNVDARVELQTRTVAVEMTAEEYAMKVEEELKEAAERKQEVIENYANDGIAFENISWKPVGNANTVARTIVDYKCTETRPGHKATLYATLTVGGYNGVDIFNTVENVETYHRTFTGIKFYGKSYTTRFIDSRRTCEVTFTGQTYNEALAMLYDDTDVVEFYSANNDLG